MKTKIATFALIAITIMSCNTSKKTTSGITSETSSTSEMTPIENTKWVLTTLEGQNMTNGEKNGQVIYFTLNPMEHRVTGFSGCNTFMGTYKIEKDNGISFSQLGMTRMACPDSNINESQIMKVFETADNFTITDGNLALNKAKITPMAIFKKGETDDNPVTEKYWKLKTLEGRDVTMAKNKETEIYFMMKADENRVVGFAGCNTIGGTYTLEEGNRIHFSNMLSTMKACPDVNVNESEFLKIFELADNYTIHNDVLSLNVGRRAALAVFEAVYMHQL